MCLFFYSCLVSLRRKPSGLYLLNKFCEETLSPGELLPVTAQNGCEEFILTKRWHNTVKEYLHALVLSFFPFSFFPFEMQLAISNLLNLDFTLLCFSFWSSFSSSIFKLRRVSVNLVLKLSRVLINLTFKLSWVFLNVTFKLPRVYVAIIYKLSRIPPRVGFNVFSPIWNEFDCFQTSEFKFNMPLFFFLEFIFFRYINKPHSQLKFW